MWDWETGWDRDALKRIVVLLFALANLADLAAGASYRRRRQVLGILNHGEVVARAFVIDMATGAAISSDDLESSGDAACLAVRLRALALMLYAMLASRAALPGAEGSRTGRPSRGMSGPAVRRLEALPRPTRSGVAARRRARPGHPCLNGDCFS
jgi:hypothetical protein